MSTVAAAVHNLAAYARTDYEGFKAAMAELLRDVDPNKPLGTALFNAVARVTPTIAFEAVAVRMGVGGPEVYLRKREANDTAYPSMWHAPGSIFRAGETPQRVAARLAGEFGTPIAHFTRVGELWNDEERGWMLSTVFLLTLEGEPRVDDNHGWFPMSDLPEGTIDFHALSILPQAVLAFMSSHWQDGR